MANLFVPMGIIVFLSGAWFFINTGQSHACSCPTPGPPSQELAESEVVFVGEVVRTIHFQPPPNSLTDPIAIEFAVNTVWKGPLYETMFIAPSRGTSCEFRFVDGEKYIVYSPSKETTPEVNLCSRTRLVAEAQDDLKELGRGHPPEPGTSAPTPKPPDRSLPIVGGCGLSPYPDSDPMDLSGLGIMLGLVWFGARRRARQQ